MKKILLLMTLFPAFIFAQDIKPFAIVELFTSEGSINCPPADKILSEISSESEKEMTEVYCLAYHVDYWNSLGWNDPFSKFQYTRRQENYSRVLPSKELYTPQMVVNGNTDFTGSDKAKAQSAISSALKKKALIQLDINLDSMRNDTAYISWNISHSDKNNVLQIAYTESGLVSKVERGENAGKTLKHDHVVRFFSAVNSPAESGHMKLFVKGRDLNLNSELVGFIQHKQDYIIVAASRIKNLAKSN